MMTTSAEFFPSLSHPPSAAAANVNAPAHTSAPLPIPPTIAVTNPYPYLPKLPAAHAMPTFLESLFDPHPLQPIKQHHHHEATHHSIPPPGAITSPTHVIDTTITNSMFISDPLPPPILQVQPQHVAPVQQPNSIYADAIDNAIAYNDASVAGAAKPVQPPAPAATAGVGGSELVWCEACEQCGKRFFKQGSLIRHIRAAHRRRNTIAKKTSSNECERLFCPKCPKTFSQQGSLNRHLRSIHEARKLHCRYCSLAFGQAFDLKRHQRRKHPHDVPWIPRRALPVFVRTRS